MAAAGDEMSDKKIELDIATLLGRDVRLSLEYRAICEVVAEMKSGKTINENSDQSPDGL